MLQAVHESNSEIISGLDFQHPKCDTARRDQKVNLCICSLVKAAIGNYVGSAFVYASFQLLFSLRGGSPRQVAIVKPATLNPERTVFVFPFFLRFFLSSMIFFSPSEISGC
mgnify:CR=1 FL=1